MRILTVHNKYLIRGGEDESREAEDWLLRERGHVVGHYLEDNRRITSYGKLAACFSATWNQQSFSKLRAAIRDFRPDVVDSHNFFPLISPAVHYAAKAENVPVAQTLHNYRLICPNAIFFRHGAVCEDCMGKSFAWPGILNGCYRGSRLGSASVASMIAVHRIIGTWRRAVSVFIALTKFARNKFIKAGLPAERIAIKPNFVAFDTGKGEGEGRYALYVGRLTREKGVLTLLEAWKILGDKIPLKIVGTGPVADLVMLASRASRAIEWLGMKQLSDVYDLMGRASFLIFPSEWYETFGRVAIEAFCKGTPVLAAKIGAVAELVSHGRTGLLFEPGNPEDLAAKAQWLVSHPAEVSCMRREARAEYEAYYTPDKNYGRLISIYEGLIGKGPSRS